jgi:hypothetical protein
MTKEQKIIRQGGAAGAGQAARQRQPGLQDDGLQPRQLLPFKELYDAGGELALQELARRKPILKNRTPPKVEAIIAQLSLEAAGLRSDPHRQRVSQARPFDLASRRPRRLAASRSLRR